MSPLVAAARDELKGGARDAVKPAIISVMSAYPAPDMADPAPFLNQACEALMDFPAVVVMRMASPRHGIVRTAKFLPRIAEMVEWCEREVASMRERLRYAERVLAEREADQRRADEANRLRIEASDEAIIAARKEREALAASVVAQMGAAHATAEEEKRKRADARHAWVKAALEACQDDNEKLDRAFALMHGPEGDRMTTLEVDTPGAGCAAAIGMATTGAPSAATPDSRE